jgi:CDP-diacylglycerol--serine O-phosphatidyltransferase
MTGGESRFGAELDSLADVVTFGAVPAAIVSSLWIRHQPDYAKWWSLVMVCGLVYVACAALRLARYNVEKSGSDKRHFRGLPSPAAAGVVVSATLFARQPYMEGLWQRVGHLRLTQSVLTPAQVEVAGLYLLGLYMLIIGLLMVTRQRFVHAANRWLHGRQRFTVLVVMVFALALLRLRPVEVLFAAFNGYVLASLAANGARALRERRRLAPVGSDGAAAKSAAEEADAPAGAAGAEGETRGPGGGRS